MRLVKRSIVLSGIALGAALASAPAASAQVQSPVTASGYNGGISAKISDGCNDHTCIAVFGTKLKVTNVVTNVTVHKQYRCTTGYFQGHAKGVKHLHTLAKTKKICGSYGHYTATWPANRTFSNGYKLCVQWSGIHGEPCETLHK